MFIVELEDGVWLANWEGDPGRTLRRDSAKQFDTKKKAQNALKRARRFRSFLDAQILNL